jgi:hypothetical protein
LALTGERPKRHRSSCSFEAAGEDWTFSPITGLLFQRFDDVLIVWGWCGHAVFSAKLDR